MLNMLIVLLLALQVAGEAVKELPSWAGPDVIMAATMTKLDAIVAAASAQVHLRALCTPVIVGTEIVPAFSGIAILQSCCIAQSTNCMQMLLQLNICVAHWVLSSWVGLVQVASAIESGVAQAAALASSISADELESRLQERKQGALPPSLVASPSDSAGLPQQCCKCRSNVLYVCKMHESCDTKESVITGK